MANYKFDENAGDRAFMLSNGNRLNSIKEFYQQIESIPDEIFDSHVNEQKNDFSAWVAGVFSESALSENLLKAKTKKEMKKKLGDWISSEIHRYHKTHIQHVHHDRAVEHEHHVHHLNEEHKAEQPADIKLDNLSAGSKKTEIAQAHSAHSHMLSGLIDFLLGFLIGALAMLLFLKMV